MWLSRVSRRGCVRMRRIFLRWRTVIGWDRGSSASIGRTPNSFDSTKLTYRDGQQLLLLPRDVLSTTTGKHSISRYPIQKNNSG